MTLSSIANVAESKRGRSQARTGRTVAQVDPLRSADMLQRTFGNQHLVRQFAQHAPATSHIQRTDDEEDEKKDGGFVDPLERARNMPLMLTDRPWSEIEKERDPAYQLMFGEDKSGLPKLDMSQLPITMEPEPEPEPEETVMDKVNRESKTLMLTDRPWKEIQKEQRRVRQQKKRAERSAKKRSEAKPPDPKKPRPSPVNDFHQQMMARIKAIRGMEGSEHFSKDIAELEHGQLRGYHKSSDTDKPTKKGETESFASGVEKKISIKVREKTSLSLLKPRKEVIVNIRKKIAEAMDEGNSTSTQRDKEFFRESGEEKLIDDGIPLAQGLRDKVNARVRAINDMTSELESSKQDSEATALKAEAMQTVPEDAEIDNYSTVTTPLQANARKVSNPAQLKIAKKAFVETYSADPHKARPHVIQYLVKKVQNRNPVTRTEADVLVMQQVNAQRSIPKAVWIRDILGYQENKKWNPGNTLYLRGRNQVRGEDTHVSVFRGTIIAGGEVPVNPPATATSIRDIFFASSVNRLEASHLTMEVDVPGSTRNPHVYRGGPADTARIVAEFGAPNAVAVENEMRAELAAELLRAEGVIQTIIDQKGSDFWPDLPT